MPALCTNYIFVAICDLGVFVVDPGQAFPVIDFLKSRSLGLDYILITHHHADHTDGIKELKNTFKNVRVIVPQKERVKIPGSDICAPSSFCILGIDFKVMDLPGHTIGHIGFYIKKEDILFCGDALFSAGCGRVFEGTMRQMLQSIENIKSLPEETKIYCAHEYTLDNLKFALYVDKENPDIQKEIAKVAQLCKNKIPTIPTVLKKEKLINPFLMIEKHHKKFQRFTRQQVFAHLRLAKDNFS